MSPGAMDSGWYYAKRGASLGQRSGPVSWEDLVTLARSGALVPEDLVWHEQLVNWRSASHIPGLFAVAPQAQPVAAAGSGAPQRKRSALLYWLIPAAVVILVALGLGLYFGLWYHGGTGFAQQEGEILLEPSGVAGPDSFAGEEFVVAGPTTTLNIPDPQVTLPAPATTTTAPTSGQSGSTSTASTIQPTILVVYPGDTPALYGGSKNKMISDKQGELAYLEANPQKAAAFCEALNGDPTFRWSGGDQVRPAQLRDYFEELTPMLLTRDIRVTNYGYKNGHPTPRQSVLQAGQLVLVDRYGVPRKRCECGNPLTPPVPSSKPPVYTGPRWPDFDPTTIIVVQQSTVIIDIFVVIDIDTGEVYGRPAGTQGGSDGPAPEGTTETTQTTAPPSTDTTVTTGPPSSDTTSTTGGRGTVESSELNGTWEGTMTISEIDIPDEALKQLQDQGCDMSILQFLQNVPLPLKMDITVNPDGVGGTAAMTIDASSIVGGGATSEPQTLNFTISGDTLIFELPPAEGVSATMTGTVSRQGEALVIDGVIASGAEGAALKGEWHVTKTTM